MKDKLVFCSLAVTAIALVGCGPSIPEDTDSPPNLVVKDEAWTPHTNAGIPITQGADPDGKLYKALAANKKLQTGAARKDPFALTGLEQQYDIKQTSYRIFSGPGFSNEFTPEPPPDTTPPTLEPQPYRRLSGIVVGDSILGIIDMGDGTPPQVIRPGQQIPNSQWKVVSIDEEKAVLRRGGNVLPKEIIVRLESPPGGAFSGGGNNPNPGGPPGGFGPGGNRPPNGPPGGFPGGGPRGGNSGASGAG